MWRELYDRQLNGTTTTESVALGFIGSVLKEVSEAVNGSPDAVKCQLAIVGQELIVPMKIVMNFIRDKTISVERKLHIMQLQTVCRLFTVCNDSAQLTLNRQIAVKKLLKRGKVGNTRIRKRKSTVQTEIHDLLDRIALLLDSSHPASIGEGDEEYSRFRQFLFDELEKPLCTLIPNVFADLRDAYELHEVTDLPSNTPMAKLKHGVPNDPTPNIVQPATNILSALKDEKPQKKRRRSDTNEAFKSLLAAGQSTKRTSITRCKAPPLQMVNLLDLKRENRRSSLCVEGRVPLTSFTASVRKPKTRRSLDSVLLNPTTKQMPKLVHNVDRSSMPVTNIRSHHQVSMNSTSHIVHPLTQSGTQVTSATNTMPTRAAIVMRTPDRQQRLPRQRSRVFIEASPPLHTSFSARRSVYHPPTLPN